MLTSPSVNIIYFSQMYNINESLVHYDWTLILFKTELSIFLILFLAQLILSHIIILFSMIVPMISISPKEVLGWVRMKLSIQPDFKVSIPFITPIFRTNPGPQHFLNLIQPTKTIAFPQTSFGFRLSLIRLCVTNGRLRGG